MTEDRGRAGRSDSASDETLSDAFWSVARQLREMSHEALAPWDITPGQLRALRVLKRHGTLRLSELSDHLRIAARSTTEVVDALESRGLIQRRPDPGDRRATLVELTEHGASVLGAIRAARGSEAERLFGRLSQTDRAHLARILRKLRN
ncbi:MAG TPA: MarR family transcriptional regulator [Streptosporangiaceae bacterium]